MSNRSAHDQALHMKPVSLVQLLEVSCRQIALDQYTLFTLRALDSGGFLMPVFVFL